MGSSLPRYFPGGAHIDQQTQLDQLVGTGEIVLGLVLVGIAIARAVKASK